MAISMLPPRLTLEQKARLKKLDERLPIMDIARLRYSEQDSDLIKSYAFDIAEACLAGEINYFHERRQSDWRWLCENPNAIPDLRYPLIGCDEIIRASFFESDGFVLLDELESEWDGESEPPAFKNNDPKSRYDRFYRNNRYKDGFRDSDAFVGYRWDYAQGGRCKVDAKEFKQWLIYKKDYPLPDGCLLTNWLNQMEAINNLEPNDGVQSQAATNQIADNPKPWLIPDPRDPSPKYEWYVSARYFARKLIEDDSTLLAKKNLLTQKVAKSMFDVGIKKRGGIKPYDPRTINKAFVKIDFS